MVARCDWGGWRRVVEDGGWFFGGRGFDGLMVCGGY